MSSMHCCNGYVVRITVMTEVVRFLWYIELRAESFRCGCVSICVCVKVRESEKEGALGLSLLEKQEGKR